jgi:hypothetical protein
MPATLYTVVGTAISARGALEAPMWIHDGSCDRLTRSPIYLADQFSEKSRDKRPETVEDNINAANCRLLDA